MEAGYIVAVILVLVIFGSKNLVRQKREDVVEQERVNAISIAGTDLDDI